MRLSVFHVYYTRAVTITPAGLSEPHPATNESRFGRNRLWIWSRQEVAATITSESTVEQAVSQQHVTS